MKPSEPGSRRTFGTDLILPVAASLYAIYYVASVWDFPPEAQTSGLVLAGLLLTLTTLFFIRTAVRALRGRWQFELASILGPKEGRANRLAFFALVLAYGAFAPIGGFTLTTFLFLAAGSWIVGLRPARRAITFGAVTALAGWLFFIVLLGTRFPKGPFEHLVSWIASSWT
jgi:hypothetical protein